MVAYSFKRQFQEPIQTGAKMQTVRGFRARHARPGEPIQLYCGMRTRACFKLIPDPICTEVREVMIKVSRCKCGLALISRIEIDGRSLDYKSIIEFAKADGFESSYHGNTAEQRMADFWLEHHGPGTFQGVLIKWEPKA